MVSRDHATERSDGFVAPAGEHGVVELDARGRIVRVSDAARRLLGVEADVRGEDHSILYDRDARAAGAPARDLQRAEALGQSEMEGWRAGKDGSPFWAEELIVPERDEAGALRTPSGAGVDAPNAAGLTALMGAAAGGHAGLVRRLLHQDARADTADARGQTPLHWGAQGGLEVVSWSGAPPST